MIHGVQACADEGGALFADAGTQGVDQADELDAGLPGEKFADVFFDDDFGARDFPFAGVTILLDDFGEVVDVVDVEVVEIRGGGIDIAGDAEIHDEESAIGAGGHGGFENLAGQDRLFGGDGRDEDIRSGESGLPVAPFDDAAGELGGEGLRFVAGAIHYVQMGDAAIAERGHDLLADGPSAEDQRAAVREFAEDTLGELYAGGGDRTGAGALFGFGADTFAGFERALEEAVEYGA